MSEIVKIDFGGDKIFHLNFHEFDSDIDVDSLTQINYYNLYAEIITISSLLNRVGNWKAEAENAYANEKLDNEIYEAKQSEYYRKKLKKVEGEKIKWPTKDEVSNAVLMDEAVQLRKKRLIRKRKEADYIDAIYWAVKDKAKRIDKISDNMKLLPEDFDRELTMEKINGIIIKAFKKRFKTTNK